MGFGLTINGFKPKRLADIKADLEGDFRTEFGQDIRVDDQCANGQLIGIVSDQLADVWDLSEQVYQSAYPSGAKGVALDRVLELAAMERSPATYSIVKVTLTGTPGTVVPSLSRARDPVTLREWIIQGNQTIGGGGSVADVPAQPADTGPIIGLAGTITEIVTAVSGWTAVTNPLDADVGQLAASDAKSRIAYNLGMRAGGSASNAIRGKALKLAGVTECVVVENDHSLPDEDGRPGHSIEVVVRGGVDQDIITLLGNSVASGIETIGNVTGTFLDDAGNNQTVKFSRPVEIDIYMAVDYSVFDNADDNIEDLILAEILLFGNAFNIARDVYEFPFKQNIETPNIQTLTIRLGLFADPPTNDPVIIGKVALAKFDSTRILFNRTN
jgi:uncharacterized phage protein gp47/JayE